MPDPSCKTLLGRMSPWTTPRACAYPRAVPSRTNKLRVKLFTLMGPGCVSVTRVQGKDADIVVGLWSDGRIGTYRGIRRGASTAGAVVFGSKGITEPESTGADLHLTSRVAGHDDVSLGRVDRIEFLVQDAAR